MPESKFFERCGESSINVANNAMVSVIAEGSENISADAGATTCEISVTEVCVIKVCR